ncbi:unnamed protein product [Vitrella brassicaformis CCMP3155]|uniref:Uncharacterized protein n=2 Tax=Vitrella brassicaformis TaxID=1169539 RepID=A0A0G4FSH2_VITBC|nr:unnamed protein product [Vitrella brassicaformis CCMP3155]|eukprot:CEM17657.1 unnamed protein product [Vitrella brassicaformis CCMP3155]
MKRASTSTQVGVKSLAELFAEAKCVGSAHEYEAECVAGGLTLDYLLASKVLIEDFPRVVCHSDRMAILAALEGTKRIKRGETNVALGESGGSAAAGKGEGPIKLRSADMVDVKPVSRHWAYPR